LFQYDIRTLRREQLKHTKTIIHAKSEKSDNSVNIGLISNRIHRHLNIIITVIPKVIKS